MAADSRTESEAAISQASETDTRLLRTTSPVAERVESLNSPADVEMIPAATASLVTDRHRPIRTL